MNNLQPKFILTQEGILRLGTAKRHCELLKAGERCIGGGFYRLDYLSQKLQLSGASSEFGEPAWENIERLVLSPYYKGLIITYRSWDDWKEEFPVSERIEITFE